MDLNRLTVENLRLLLLLERHRSLTEAANRLGVSVPTASRMLAKLREAFDDELFVRNASQMSPTGVAAASAPRIERALAGLESVSQDPETFSPGRCRRCFRLMMHEQLLAAHLTEVRARIARLAPDVTLEMRSVSDEGFDRLKTGEIDFLVFPMDDNRHPDVRSAALCEAAFDVLVRKDHPWLALRDAAGRPDWSALTRYDKVQLTIDSFGTRAPGELDDWIFRGSFPRQRTAVWTPCVHAGAHLLLDSNLTMITYRPLAERLVARGGFASAPIDSPESRYCIAFMWHERYDDDAALEWMRSVFVSVFRSRASACCRKF